MKDFFNINQFRTLVPSTLGLRCFQLGLLFLPASAFISGLFLLMASVLSSINRSDSYWNDFWNYPLVVVAVLMIIGCFRAYSGWLAWVGLANWLPFFWIFWALQPYLETPSLRKHAAICLVIGTFPVILTGLGQMFFQWEGPWQIFNGLIIWFIAPGGRPLGRLSGLFDYANIAGAWLVLVWPFCLATLIQPMLSVRNRIVSFCFSVATVLSLVLTNSRNAWGGLILAVPLVLGPISWFWLLPLLLFSLLPILLAVSPGVNLDIQKLARQIVPESLWARLNDATFKNTRSLASTRISQWQEAIKLVPDKFWFGWGAAAFSVLYPLRKGLWHGHAHNLPLELAVAHGFPVAFLLVTMTLLLLIIALYRGSFFSVNKQKKFSQDSLFDRAWWTSLFLLICLHGTDMPLFDSRINLAGWILLAGLRSFIRVPNTTQKFSRVLQ